MNRGYTFFWRKTWDNDFLYPKSHVFTKGEAWNFLVNHEAQGIDDPESGLKRGEFEASVRYLAKSWLWSKSRVERFLADLVNKSMINQAGQQTGHLAGQQTGHFSICNYDSYNPTRDTKRDSKRDSKQGHPKEGIKEGFKKEELSPSDSSPEPSKNDDSGPYHEITLPQTKGRQFRIPIPLLGEWKIDYPGVDVEGEIRKMRAWLVSNPTRVKSNVTRFANSWLARAQDNGNVQRGTNGNGSRPLPLPEPEPVSEEMAEVRRLALEAVRRHTRKAQV